MGNAFAEGAPGGGSLSDLVDESRKELAFAPNNLERLGIRDSARRIAALAAVLELGRLRDNAAGLVGEAERAIAASRPNPPGGRGPRRHPLSHAEFDAACDEAADRLLESERRPRRPTPEPDGGAQPRTQPE